MNKYDIHLFETGWSIIDVATGQPVFEPKAHDAETARVMAIGAADALNARDAELARLRAELARLQPLADAAVAVAKADTTTLVDAGQWLLLKAAVKYARAQAQDGAA